MGRLLVRPSFHVEKREKEAPYKYPLFAPRDLEGHFGDFVRVFWIRNFLEEHHGLDAVFGIVVLNEVEPVARSKPVEFVPDVVLGKRAVKAVQAALPDVPAKVQCK